MNLSKDTVAILKNFAAINGNFFSPGDTKEIKTWTIKKNIFAKANLDEAIPSELPIYDLNELLSVVDFYKDGANTLIDLKDTYAVISDGGTSKIKYAYTEKELLSYPDKDLVIDDYNVSFDLTKDDISGIMKAASVLGAPDIQIKNNDGSIDVIVYDKKVPNGSTYEMNLGDVDAGFQFELQLKIENLKIMTDKDYTLSIADGKPLIFLKSKDDVIEYFIAIERDSVLGSGE